MIAQYIPLTQSMPVIAVNVCLSLLLIFHHTISDSLLLAVTQGLKVRERKKRKQRKKGERLGLILIKE